MKSTWLYNSSLYLVAAIAVLACDCPSAISDSQEQSSGQVEVVDDLCGPRCVRFILERYDTRVDLLTLIRETKWAQRTAGASLADLQQALESRGVHTAVLQIGPKTLCDWPTPVLAHLRAEGEQGGHYVVIVPGARNGKLRVWDGLRGTTDRPVRKLQAEMSGYILLTSAEPVVAPERALRTNFGISKGWILATLAGIAIALFVVVFGRAWIFKFPGHSAPHSKGETCNV